MDKIFTDRESGTYGGLMLTLRKYLDRLEPHPGYKLNRKPREIDCLLIDKMDPAEPMDNDIARIFSRHNIVELKNPRETLSVDTIWKVISYAAQYKSEGAAGKTVPVSDVTITMLRAAKPRKAIRELNDEGYTITNPYAGIYYISGMVNFRMQIVVTSELKGDDYVPLRMQRKNAARDDYRKFAENVRDVYTDFESDYVESVVKYGIYDERTEIAIMAEEDKAMYNELMELFKDDIDKKVAEGEARGEARGEAKGRAEGEAERKGLEERIKILEAELKKAKVAVF